MEENPERNIKEKSGSQKKKISAIVLAAGSGRRMNSGEKKTVYGSVRHPCCDTQSSGI